MDYKNLKLSFFLFLFLFIGVVFSYSLVDAQELAKKYKTDNEIIDNYVHQPIVCEEKDFFLIPVLNQSSQEIVFFVIIDVANKSAYFTDNKDFATKLVKSGYVLRKLKYSSKNNYLSEKLIDNLDQKINSLNSKKSRIEGFIKRDDIDYELKESLLSTKNKLVNLLDNLIDIKDNLTDLLNSQKQFINSPNCSEVSMLILKFNDSFTGYKELPNQKLEYIDSVNDSTQEIVSNENIDGSEKNSMINFIEPPSSLNSDISSIYEYLSSTYQFYSEILDITLDIKENKTLKTYVDNYYSRKDYVRSKDLLYSYDSDFSNYQSLDIVIQTILLNQNKDSWKEQDLVNELEDNYSKINRYYSNKEYNKTIDLIKKSKIQAKEILEAGFLEKEINNTYKYIVFGLLLVILGFAIYNIIKTRKSKNPKKPKEIDNPFT